MNCFTLGKHHTERFCDNFFDVFLGKNYLDGIQRKITSVRDKNDCPLKTRNDTEKRSLFETIL